jgi:hypothetical protein
MEWVEVFCFLRGWSEVEVTLTAPVEYFGAKFQLERAGLLSGARHHEHGPTKSAASGE